MEEKAEETKEIIYRVCYVCKQRKPLSEFYSDTNKESGKSFTCKECKKAQSKKYYAAHKKEITERIKKYCEYHKDEITKQKAKYNADHKTEIAKQRVKYQEDHKEEIANYCKDHKDKIARRIAKYYEDHKDEITKQKAKYAAEHKEEIAEYQKVYREDNKEEIAEAKKQYRQSERGGFLAKQNNRRRRVRQRASKRDLTPGQWQRILKNQGYKCNMCGKKFCKSRKPTIDHIIPLSKSGGFTSSNVQALCQSCNSRKKAKIMKCFINSWAEPIQK